LRTRSRGGREGCKGLQEVKVRIGRMGREREKDVGKEGVRMLRRVEEGELGKGEGETGSGEDWGGGRSGESKLWKEVENSGEESGEVSE